MILGTANIQNYPDMTKDQVKDDARQVARNTEISGLQEVSPEDASPVLTAMNDIDKHWEMLHMRFETPIVFRSDLWNPFEQMAIGPFKRDYPLTIRNSAVTGCAFQSLERSSIKIAVVNCHLLTTPVGSQPKRIDDYRSEFAAVEELVAHYVEMGLTVFVAGDYNDRSADFPSAHGQWLVGKTRIDKIGVRQNHVKVSDNWRSMVIPLHSDHDLLALITSLHYD